MPTKYQAPALARGIEVFRTLEANGPLTLDGVARQIAAPKSSLLRILNTLAALGLVNREGPEKAYRAHATLLRLDRSPEQFTRRVDEACRRLAAAGRGTAEWYVPGQKGMVLVQRAVPPDHEVRVMARIGFVRHGHGELEAVSCLAAAWRGQAPKLAGWWAFTGDGRQSRLAAGEVRRRLDAARSRGWVLDEHFNDNGVRRTACVVLDGEIMAGVLALAENFTPEAAAQRAARLRLLTGEAAMLFERSSFVLDRGDDFQRSRS